MKCNSIFLLLFLFASAPVLSQQILLDKPTRAGELILFPELGEGNKNYYYLPDKPRLGIHPDGKPMFSFIRFVKNQATNQQTNSAITESQIGGGVVHALVEMHVSDEQVKEAERALQRLNAGAKIVGPVVFKSGSVALVSAVADKSGEYAKTVVGVGSAPVLENQKAAVAVMLNALGAKILWETFNTPTPDFSILFEMEVTGFLAPKSVTIEADFDQMYKNKTFEAAVATPVIQAEIGFAIDDMMNKGIIKVTQIGDDQSLDRMRDAVCTQIMNLMFEKVGGTGVPQINQLMGMNNQPSILDRASTMLQRNQEADRRAQAASSASANNATNSTSSTSRPQANPAPQATPPTPAPAPTPRDTSASGNTSAPADTSATASRAPAADTGSTTPAATTPASNAPPPTASSSGNTPSTGGGNRPSNSGGQGSQQNSGGGGTGSSLAIAVSYKMREMRQRGKYFVNFNKYTETTSPQTFAYNPGNVRKQCPECFREVNLEDPLMQQREINATLGGMNAADFGHYVNFVNVVLRKSHENGQETVREIKIDKTQFNQTGNFYKMLYGYQGDKNRLKWLNYEFKTSWSFFGDYSVETPWQKSDFGSIALEPPFVRKTIYLEVDPDFVKDEQVRAVEVVLFSQLGNKEDTERTMLKTNRDELSRSVEILLPRNVEDYEYQITWFVKGKEPRQTERKKTQYGRIDLDHF